MPLLKLDAEQRRGHAPTASVVHEALEGIRYVLRHPGMGPLFLFAATIGVLIRGVQEMLPPFIAGLFGRGAEGLATVSSAIGLAALVGGTLIALHGRLTGLSRLAIASAAVLALATAGFVAAPVFGVAVLCAGMMWIATTVHGIAVQTLLQSATAGHMIGRVISLWGMVTRAGPAIGALTYGATAEVAGLRLPVLVGCVIALGACAAALRRLPRMVRALEAL
jgi:MFS family permease